MALMVFDETAVTPARLEWTPVAMVEYYAVIISGKDIHGDFLVSATTSVELSYHRIVFKNSEARPR